jgi:hypothetical protein
MTKMLKKSFPQILPIKIKTLMLASVGIACMALPFLALPVAKANNDRYEGAEGAHRPAAIEGTWVVQESLDPQSVPPGVVLNFTRLETYAAGGGYIATNNGPGAGGPPSQGNWVAIGHHRFATTELRLAFDAANVYTGSNKIRSQITINERGDEFTGTVLVDIILPNGTVLPVHPVGTFHGTRLPIETLN